MMIVTNPRMFDLQHGICLVPAQIGLNVYSCFRLYTEADQAQHQKEGRVDVPLPRGILRSYLRIPLFEARTARRSIVAIR